jgi:hypothetical protein
MQNEKKGCVTIALAFLVFSVIAMPLPVANAAGTITLSATSATPGTSITVSGAGFGATKAVGIGFGSEQDVINGTMTVTGPFDVAIGPYTGFVSYFPIKPGTFRVSININRAPTWSPASPDFGNGSLGDPLNISRNGTINYVTGQYTRFMNVPISSTNYIVHLVNYTRYQHNLTSASGVTTSSSGSFTTNIVVPNTSNGIYTVTAIDTNGNIATSSLTVVGGTPALVATAFCNVAVLPGWTWNFFVHSTGGTGAYTYQWYEGTTPLQGQTSMILSVAKTIPGSYLFYCKVIDSQGTTANSNTVTLTVIG